jgi:hypothetical protein
MRDVILHGELEPNAPETIRKKGFDQPLIETSELLDAIGYQIVREGGGILAAGAASGDFEGSLTARWSSSKAKNFVTGRSEASRSHS